jgi:hypothetical protein
LKGKLNEDESGIEILGSHDIDYKWMQEVRAGNKDIKIGENKIMEKYSSKKD